MKELSMFAKVSEDALIPVRGTPDSAGVDVFFYTTEDHPPSPLAMATLRENGHDSVNSRYEIIQPNETKLLRSGIRLKEPLPRGYYIQMSLRSSWRKKGLDSHGVGIIDGDYLDEIMHLVHNSTNKPIHIHNGERLSQFVVHARLDVKSSIRNALVDLAQRANRIRLMVWLSVPFRIRYWISNKIDLRYWISNKIDHIHKKLKRIPCRIKGHRYVLCGDGYAFRMRADFYSCSCCGSIMWTTNRKKRKKKR